MKIGIVGAGISGLVCAYLLDREHEVVLFEREDRLGGHSNTVDVEIDGRRIPVDTGFIVFNPGQYPGFVKLLDRLGVASQPTRMSFSVRDDRDGFEYGGATLSGLFARRRSAVDPSFLRMLGEIRRFGLEGERLVDTVSEEVTVGEHLRRGGYSDRFVRHYLVPMGASIWSMPPRRFREFPLRSLLRFFHNHGMLRPWRPPQWRTVMGGARTYVDAIRGALRGRIQSGRGVESVERSAGGVLLRTASGIERVDEVILASHSDESLAMLADPSVAEREALGAIPYETNVATLHTDAALLPRRRAAWAGWNFHSFADDDSPVALTYHMNILQSLPTSTPMNVTLNSEGMIDPAKVIATFEYRHPQYTRGTFAAQRRHGEISGVNRTHYCGAYWGYGFHEDGVQSALRVCARFGATL